MDIHLNQGTCVEADTTALHEKDAHALARQISECALVCEVHIGGKEYCNGKLREDDLMGLHHGRNE